MRRYIIISFLGLSLLLGSCVTKKKYKRLSAKHQTLQYELDSTRYLLAEALREWKKIRDRSSMATGELQALTKKLDDEKQLLGKQLDEMRLENEELKTRVQKTQEALGLLQKEWGTIAEQQAILESQTEKIQLELVDSLSAWDSLGLDIIRVRELLHLEISDQILFDKGYYVNNAGRKFLKALAPILEKQQSKYQVVIRAVVMPKEGVWAEEASLKRALNVAKMLRKVGFRGKALRVVGMGEWRNIKAGELPPVGIDLIPVDNIAFRKI